MSLHGALALSACLAVLVAGCKSDSAIAPIDTTGGSGSGGTRSISLITSAPMPVRLAVANGTLFWLDSSDTPLKRISVAGGASTVLVRHVPNPERAISDGKNIYWVAGGELYRTSLDGATTTLIDHGERDAASGATPAVVDDGANLYRVNTISSLSCSPACTWIIRRVAKSGAAATTLVTTSQPINDLTVTGGFLIWEEDTFGTITSDGSVGSAIKKISVVDGTVTTIVNGLLNGRVAPPSPGYIPAGWHPRGGIKTDGAAVYFADYDFNGSGNYRLMRVPLAGGAIDSLYGSSGGDLSSAIQEIVLDDANIYFLDEYSLKAVPKGGHGSIDLATGLTSPASLTRVGTTLFWLEAPCCAHKQKGAISSVSTSGGPPTTIKSNIDSPVSLSADASRLYWTDGGLIGGIEGFAGITSIGFDGSAEATLVEATGGGPFAVDANYLYFANRFAIKRVSVTGGPAERLAIGDGYVQDVATDGRFVYWSEDAGNLILRRMPVGGGAFTTLATGASPGGKLQLDANYVYWLDGEDAVVRIPKVGGSPETIVPATTGFLTDFVIDGVNVYAAQWDDKQIIKTPLAGGGAQILAQLFVDQTRRLATDGKMVYWIDQLALNKVPVNGGETVNIAAGLQTLPDPPSGIALDGASVFWTEVRGSAIKKATPK